MSEQIIAAELTRDERNTVTSILFNGVRYEPARRAVVPLPPELLLPDPDLMASPEGDVKGLRELQDAARAAVMQRINDAGARLEVHTATEWAAMRGYRIVDPDGWRVEGAPPFDALIDEVTFMKHLGTCTIGPL